MVLLPFPYSANIEASLSEANPVIKLLRNKTAATVLLLVSLLNPFEVFAVNCEVQSPLVCLDSTPCKAVNGVQVCLANVTPLPPGALQSTETCWQAQGTYDCVSPSVVNDTCGTLRANSACGVISSNCVQTDPNTGACQAYTDTYQCQTGGGVGGSQKDCSGITYCSNGVCFGKQDKPNGTLVKAVTAMELARQSGFYIDPATMTIFKGDSAWCTVNTLGLANCCKPDAKGMSATDALIVNQLIQSGWNAWVHYYIGSGYTFDTLYDKAVGFVDTALAGMADTANTVAVAGYTGPVTGTATSGTGNFTTFGGGTSVTGAGVGAMIGGTIGQAAGSSLVANNGGNTIWTGIGGAAGYAGGYVAGTYAGAYASYASIALANTGSLAQAAAAGSAGGSGAVVSICWPCLIAMVVLMIIMALLACDVPEIKTQMKLGARLCHEVGSYCSADTGLGQCLTMRHVQCCFNSKLARIVNEQGRPQIGKSWGAPQSPDCTGFTVDQLQALDFSKMDLSEFVNDVVAQSTPDPTQLSNQIQGRLSNYYSSTSTGSMNGVIPAPGAGVAQQLTVNTVSPNPPPPMPTCTWTLTKMAPLPNGDQTGTFAVTSCLPSGTANWQYNGNCPAMQGGNPVTSSIDANGNTSFTTTVFAACLSATGSVTQWKNYWQSSIIGNGASMPSGMFQTQW